MNDIACHESAIWFFIAQKLLFANQYVRKFKTSKFKKKLKMIKKNKISKIKKSKFSYNFKT
jgi:hypothetical protein